LEIPQVSQTRGHRSAVSGRAGSCQIDTQQYQGRGGDAKREEVRFLILSGLPHAEVVKRSGVSSGTVSLIRNEIRAVIPLYRNSESGSLRAICVPKKEKFAVR